MLWGQAQALVLWEQAQAFDMVFLLRLSCHAAKDHRLTSACCTCSCCWQLCCGSPSHLQPPPTPKPSVVSACAPGRQAVGGPPSCVSACYLNQFVSLGLWQQEPMAPVLWWTVRRLVQTCLQLPCAEACRLTSPATLRQGSSSLVAPASPLQVSVAAVLWGAGTALGEIPPYAFSYHAAKAGIRNEEIDRMFGSQQTQGTGAGLVAGFVNGMKAWMMKFIQTCALQRCVAHQCMGACSALMLRHCVHATCGALAEGVGQHES